MHHATVCNGLTHADTDLFHQVMNIADEKRKKVLVDEVAIVRKPLPIGAYRDISSIKSKKQFVVLSSAESMNM